MTLKKQNEMLEGKITIMEQIIKKNSLDGFFK
jgi:hypothetical protein